MRPTYRSDRRPRVPNASPNDAAPLDRFVSLAKTNAHVKYLLEQDKLSVDDLFNREIDVRSLEEKVLKSL